MRHTLRVVGIIAVAALLAVPALTADPFIQSGSDLWVTPADGSSHTSFELEPLPAGFFCAGSEPFDGKIAFQGAPLATQPVGALGRTDTVVERLDDAYFDEHGVATTRIQLRALSLVGIESLRNQCGEFNVSMTLAEGDQPTTTMTLVKTHSNGGIYHAPLSLNVRITFTPVAGGQAVSVEKRVDLGPSPGARWQFAAGRDEPVRRFIGKPFVQLDTDGIRGTDQVVPLESNFRVITHGLSNAAGALQEPAQEPVTAICPETALAAPSTGCSDPNCHSNATSSHCTCDGGCTYY